MIVVLDTNILVSGFLKVNGKPGRIIDLLYENRFQVAYDDRILGEYEDILARPKFGIEPYSAHSLISYIELTGKLINSVPLPSFYLPDPDDLPFAEVFIAANAQALVTGNTRHFNPMMEKGLPVYSPAQFIDHFFPCEPEPTRQE